MGPEVRDASGSAELLDAKGGSTTKSSETQARTAGTAAPTALQEAPTASPFGSAAGRPGKGNRLGLKVPRRHTAAGADPFESVEWTHRRSVITNPDGSVVFSMEDVEVPSGWTQLATDIIVSKYFRKAGVKGSDGSDGPERSARQVVHRIAHTVRGWGEQHGYFASKTDAEAFEAELTWLLVTQRGAFNSPVWFNCGLWHDYAIQGGNNNWTWDMDKGGVYQLANNYERPQCSACFIQKVEDNLVEKKGIFELLASEARIFKYGSGTGSNFSRLRSKYEKLSGGGTSSGLMSFLKVLDAGAGATKSGGTTRRAAKMVILDVDHPEIEDFIEWKVKEERKVAALIAAGYDSDFNGEAYGTVSGQNSNNSVRVTDAFMQAVLDDKDWTLTARTDGSPVRTVKAKELWERIAKAAWACADPGVQYDSTINRWHTCKAADRINGSNPCSEYMFLDDTACNLASINLLKYLNEDGSFDVEGYRHAIEILFIAQEILVDLSSYPTRTIAENSHDYRPLGLGYANLGALLMVMGLPYDSPEGRALSSALTAILTGHAYKVSAEMARVKGPFAAWDRASTAAGRPSDRPFASPDGSEAGDPSYATNGASMMEVMRMHRDAAVRLRETGSPLQALEGCDVSKLPMEVLDAAVEDWEATVGLGDKYGLRNAQATVLAPTGTIGLLMDCDTTGVEPDFSLVKYKKLAGGGYFKIINQSVPPALANLGYSKAEIDAVVKYAIGYGTLEGGPIEKETFLKKGFTEAEYQEAYDAVAASRSFNDYTPRVSPKAMREKGFTKQAVQELVWHVQGHETVEGAPFLRAEHYSIFDCANRCGDGNRFIHHLGHIRMMGAVQPFISGAISKTINMPNEVSVADVQDAYLVSWKLGLKAVALYRDGSKLSQPLNSTKQERDELVVPKGPAHGEMVRPPRNNDQGFKRTVTIFTPNGAEKVDIHVWEYPDGRPCEIFIGARKAGTLVDNFLKELGKNYSRMLQLGMSLDELSVKLMNEHGPLGGQTDHAYIKRCLGIQDFLGKMLRYEYFGETQFLSVKPDPGSENYTPTRREFLEVLKLAKMRPRSEKPLTEFVGTEAPTAKGTALPVAVEPELDELLGKAGNGAVGVEGLYEQFGGDAPDCDLCGYTTVRNGACYKCMNCGNSMGCS